MDGGSQRRAFVSTPERRNESIKYFMGVGIESIACCVYNHTFVPLCHDCLQNFGLDLRYFFYFAPYSLDLLALHPRKMAILLLQLESLYIFGI